MKKIFYNNKFLNVNLIKISFLKFRVYFLILKKWMFKYEKIKKCLK